MAPTPTGRANGDRRLDSRVASVVTSALRLSTAKGRVQAWHYLRKHELSAQVALRVLSTRGPRRNSDARPGYQAYTVPGTTAGGGGQHSREVRGPGDAGPPPNRRVNDAAAAICERAVGTMQTESRDYAESLLRMYSLKTATIMRVLYHPKLRRR